MSNINDSVYNKCLVDTGIQESALLQTVKDKFKTACRIITNNNIRASFDELCESCGVILKLLIEKPDIAIPVGRFLI